MNSLSWASPTAPNPTEADARSLFERLFGDGGTPEQRQAELKTNKSILDSVLADISGLHARLGTGDRDRVNEYLDTVREVERRIQRAEQSASDSPLTDLSRPTSVPEVWEDHVKLMCDLQVLALRADLTRIITFQMARETSTRTYPQIGVPDPHHPISHHTNDPEKLAQLAKINQYHVSLFAYLVDQLQQTEDGDGTLLDHTTYLLGSGLGNPNVHDHRNLPIAIERCCTRLRSERWPVATSVPTTTSGSSPARGRPVVLRSLSTRQTDGFRPGHPMASDVTPLTLRRSRTADRSTLGRTSR